MFYVSDCHTTPPTTPLTPLQAKAYETFDKLAIPFQRVDNDPAVTMEDCIAINQQLDAKVVKTLFLCNQQKTRFYLFITPGEKPFRTKDFSHALEISRVSFAPEKFLEPMLGTVIGSTTIFSTLLDTENQINVIVDREILKEEWFGCSDGTTTSYLKLKTADIFDKFLPYAKHKPTMIDV